MEARRIAMSRELEIEPAAASPPLRMSYEEFLAWADEDTHAEWVDGEVVPMSPVSERHADLADFLRALVRHFLEAHRLGRMLSEPFQMKTRRDLPGRSPGLLVLLNENLSRLRKNYLDGPADLVVEIVSPDSVVRDHETKPREYEEGGVSEYWLIDPLLQQAEFYQRGEDGRYHPLRVGEDGVFHSAVLPGLWLNVAWLWQDPLPPLMSVLKQWGLV
jgi:Uma2 family endonuclease